MPRRLGGVREPPNIWPGFVDALATLLMVVMFVLMIFSVAQFFLTQAISGKDSALQQLQSQMSELADLLALERKSGTDMRLNIAQLSEELRASVATRDQLSGTLEALTLRAENAETIAGQLGADLAEARRIISVDRETIQARLGDIAALQALKDELERQTAALADRAEKSEGDLIEERKVSESARAQAALLNRQMAALRQQLADLQATLDEAEKAAKEQNIQISNLGQRLNAALAGRVQELSRYRSEFFGRLREILGDHPDIRIVGDRFVFQSEVLFDTGSAELGENGKQQMAQLAAGFREMAARIPDGLNWVLEIDGHTDKVPIRTALYPSNWELSTARATSVVKFLIGQGIPPHRLAAAGFGEYQPLDNREDEIALRRNRRIELKLTDR